MGMKENKRFTVHIKWYNYDKTEGEIELFDNGQPLLVSECIEDVRMVKGLLNELAEEKDYFERKKEYFLSKWSIANAENIQLRQENKELKKHIHELENRLYITG